MKKERAQPASIDAEQVAVMLTYAKFYGRTWKARLRAQMLTDKPMLPADVNARAAVRRLRNNSLNSLAAITREDLERWTEEEQFRLAAQETHESNDMTVTGWNGEPSRVAIDEQGHGAWVEMQVWIPALDPSDPEE